MARHLGFEDVKDIKLDPKSYQIDWLKAISRRRLETSDDDLKKKRKEEVDQKKVKAESETLHVDLLSSLFSKGKRSKRKPRMEFKFKFADADHNVLSLQEILGKESLPKKPVMDDGLVTKKSVNILPREEILKRETALKRPMASPDYEILPSKMTKSTLFFRGGTLRRVGLQKIKPIVNDDDYGKGAITNCKKKKKVLMNHGPNPPPGLPREFMDRLQELAQGKSIENPVLVIQKGLYSTDISSGHNRFSIPMRLMANKFLTDKEATDLELYTGTNVNKMEISIIEPSLEVGTVSFRRWAMKKESNNPSISYVLTGTWNSIVSKYNLREGDLLQVWALRIDGDLWLALVLLPRQDEVGPSSTKGVFS